MKHLPASPSTGTVSRSLQKAGAAGVLLFVIATITSADDRFTVPTSPDSSPASSPPPPPPPSPPSNSGSSSGSSSTYTPPPSTSDSGGRFTVPSPTYFHGTGSSGFQGGYNGYHGSSGYYGYPYWGGCYYWDGEYYFWGGHRYSPFQDRFYYDGFPYQYSAQAFRQDADVKKIPIFFPPTPPPIGAPKPPKHSPVERTAAPTDLAGYVYEPFYAPLSTRLHAKDLSRKLLTRIDNYRTKRSALQAELQQKLASLKDASPAERIRQLENFSKEQTPRIAELENTAEQLRRDLLLGGLAGFFAGTGDWNETRSWRLGTTTSPSYRTQNVIFEFLVMRAAVFYQDGLSPAQRRLLREIAMDLQVEAFKPKDAEKSDEKWLYFSPETTRIPIPSNIPEELESKIALFQNEKNRLKTELRDKLYTLDNASESKRAQALRQLAEQQATAIASLEILADDIRNGLAALPVPPGPKTGPGFPPDLSSRIASYLKEKQELQKTIQARLEDIRKETAPQSKRLTSSSSDSDFSYRLEGRYRVPKEDLDKMREAVNLLNKEHAQRFAALDKEKEAIRSAVTAFAATHRTENGTPSVKSLLVSFLDALREEEAWQPYADYKTAVYQPGLSPEQRRLLFEIALEKLTLPLPDGEF